LEKKEGGTRNLIPLLVQGKGYGGIKYRNINFLTWGKEGGGKFQYRSSGLKPAAGGSGGVYGKTRSLQTKKHLKEACRAIEEAERQTQRKKKFKRLLVIENRFCFRRHKSRKAGGSL